MPIRTVSTLALVAALALSTTASAATVVVTTSLDVVPAASYYDPTKFTPFSVDLAEGDTFDYTVHFLGGKTLTLTDAVFLWFASFTDKSTPVTGTGTLSLLDSSGHAFLTSQVKTDTESFVHFGQYFYASDFAGGLPTTLTFAGLHYVGTVDDYTDPTITTRTYAQPFLEFADVSTTVGGAPEPGTWALLVTGFGLIGSATRRRRAAAA